MIEVPLRELNYPPEKTFYLPHHAILKPASTSTKLRVVFNASQKLSTGVSLNDCLHIGPKLQQDLATIIMRWRLYPYVYNADIEKMFRQILVDPLDANMQRIVWRENPLSPLRDFKLLTVTYGTASAPFLACRTLCQLAYDYQAENSIGSTILLNNFYVDDALFGAYDFNSALEARKELVCLLSRAGFTLRKWAANEAALLQDVSDQDKEPSTVSKLFSDSQIKTHGIVCLSYNDSFQYDINLSPRPMPNTKRNILSDIGRLFDPIGWLAPVVITAKIFLQKLWLANWDEELPSALSIQWSEYRASLEQLKQVNIPRWIGMHKQDLPIEIYGFCDASMWAYAAVVYIRVLQDDHSYEPSLISCKTKVAPIKTISVPRLELCGAALLPRLICIVKEALQLDSVPIYAWADSSIVLTWLKSHPSKWETFVANRTSTIQTTLPDCKWRFVSTLENPADCASRGITTAEFINHNLWWHGPNWLRQHSVNWLQNVINKPTSCNLEERVSTSCYALINDKEPWTLLGKYSSMNRLLRITALCQRFVYNCSHENKIISPLSATELEAALMFWIRYVQHLEFPAEMRSLGRRQPLPKKSKLLSLHPFLDKDQLLRVGGRIRNSYLSYSECHPLIVPCNSTLATLLIVYAHDKTLHGGVQLSLQHLRTRYWILNSRKKVRSYIHKCIRCVRHRSATLSQLMGDLLDARVRPSKPFEFTGLDYAGPISITALKHRGSKSHKAYIALFVCFSTRAIHLELVANQTSNAFIAIFRRFISRRGRCRHLYSDNATTFVGADAILQGNLREALNQSSSSLRKMLAEKSTEWHFIPPASPHVGGSPKLKWMTLCFSRMNVCHLVNGLLRELLRNILDRMA